jgi:hypothetical protein
MSTELPLFAAGFHDLAFDGLRSVFVDPFPESLNRPRLLKGLEDLLTIVRGFPLNLEIWIDGSFSTRKDEPGDVDLLILADQGELNSMSFVERKTLRDIVMNRPYIKAVYFCDLFLILKASQNDKIYWRGCFGFDKLDGPKGIPWIFFNHA